MKNKLIAAMLLLAGHINGMEVVQLLEETSDSFLQFSMDIEGDVSPQDRVNELEEYYQSESKLKGNKALQDLNEVFSEEDRKSFFEELVSKMNDITNDAAMLDYINSAATSIIRLPEYDAESSDNSDESSMDSANFVYKPPFLFTLVEALEPITWVYIGRVQAAAK